MNIIRRLCRHVRSSGTPCENMLHPPRSMLECIASFDHGGNVITHFGPFRVVMIVREHVCLYLINLCWADCSGLHPISCSKPPLSSPGLLLVTLSSSMPCLCSLFNPFFRCNTWFHHWLTAHEEVTVCTNPASHTPSTTSSILLQQTVSFSPCESPCVFSFTGNRRAPNRGRSSPR